MWYFMLWPQEQIFSLLRNVNFVIPLYDAIGVIAFLVIFRLGVNILEQHMKINALELLSPQLY